jgi:hypothetical protein
MWLTVLMSKKINGLFIEICRKVSRIKSNLVFNKCEINGEISRSSY